MKQVLPNSNHWLYRLSGIAVALGISLNTHANEEKPRFLEQLSLDYTQIFSEGTLQQISRGQFPLPTEHRTFLGLVHTQMGARFALAGQNFEMGVTDLSTIRTDNRVVYWLSKAQLDAENFKAPSYPLSGQFRQARYFEVSKPFQLGNTHQFSIKPKWVLVDQFRAISGQGLISQTPGSTTLQAQVQREQIEPLGYFNPPPSSAMGQGVGADFSYRYEGRWNFGVSAKNAYSQVWLDPGFVNDRNYNLKAQSGVFQTNPDQPALVGSYAQKSIQTRLPSYVEWRAESPPIASLRALAGAYTIEGAHLPWWGARWELTSIQLSYLNLPHLTQRLILSRRPQSGRSFYFSLGLQSSPGTREWTQLSIHWNL